MSNHLNLETPSGITALALGPLSHLVTGSGACSTCMSDLIENDGYLRLYRLPSHKVARAVKGLNQEVSSVAFVPSTAKKSGEAPSELDEQVLVWVACGIELLLFDFSDRNRQSLLILESQHSKERIKVLDQEDVLNGIAASKTHVAYTSDAGEVGVLDIKTKVKTVMRTQHSSIASVVSFIPDRPRELLSGGYDHFALHFDFGLGTLSSQLEFSSVPDPSSTNNMALSPPFVTSLAVSPVGLSAYGLADGRVWLGFGGVKGGVGSSSSSSAKTQKKRKWGGLSASVGCFSKIAEGPVTGLAFEGTSGALWSLTLVGILTLHALPASPSSTATLDSLFTAQTERIKKTNALAVREGWVAVGGVNQTGKGFVELWQSSVIDGKRVVQKASLDIKAPV